MSVLSDEQLVGMWPWSISKQEVEVMQTIIDAAIAADRAARAEPIYAYRRMGFEEFCTCDERRYLELSEKQNFEVTIFYTTRQAAPVFPDGWAIEGDKHGVDVVHVPSQCREHIGRDNPIVHGFLSAMLTTATVASQ